MRTPPLACFVPMLVACLPAVFCPAADLGWSYPPTGPLRVHVIRGSSYYTRDFRVDDVLARAGVGWLTESTQEDRSSLGFRGGAPAEAGWLTGQADPAGQAMDHHLIIACSVSASGIGKNQDVLVDYVQNGGSVLFFCDGGTFGDRSSRSSLAEMAPIALPGEGPWALETESVNDGVVLKAGPDCPKEQTSLLDAAADNPPRVYSYYQVQPKPNAKQLLLTGDGRPLLLLHEFGRGQVAVFTATCRGYPKEGQLAYWKWDGWPALLAATVERTAQTTGNAPHGLDENGRSCVAQARRRAHDLLDGLNESAQAEFEAQLSAAAARCHDEATAEFLLGIVADYPPDLPNELASELGQTLSPWIGKGSSSFARALLGSGQVGKTILGLIALGAVADDARAELIAFYRSGAPHGQAGAGISLARGDSQGVATIMRLEENARQIRHAAVIGLGVRGDSAALPLLRKAMSTLGTEGRFPLDKTPDVLTPAHRDYQNAVVSALLCGDATVAESVVDFLLVNESLAARSETEENQRPEVVAWQRQLLRRMTRTPDIVLPALAERIAREENNSITATAIAVFGGRRLPEETARQLAVSPVAAVAEIGKRNRDSIPTSNTEHSTTGGF